MAAREAHTEIWPALPFEEWKETCATLHMWTQVVGKIRLSLAPWTNHSWHVALYNSARPHNFSNSASRWNFRNSFRFHRSRIAHSKKRRSDAGDRAAPKIGCGILSRDYGRAER